MRSRFMTLFIFALSALGVHAGTPQVTLPDTNIYEQVVIINEKGVEEVFLNVEVREVEPDAITIAHSKGGYRVPYEQLPTDWQDRYGLDEESAAAYRAEQEEAAERIDEQKEAAKAKAESLDKIDDGSVWIRVDDILKKGSQGTVLQASIMVFDTVEETYTNSATGLKGPTQYSHKVRDPYRYRKTSTTRPTTDPGTTLERKSTSAPRVSSRTKTTENWETMDTPIVLVESPDIKKDWTGAVYPCGYSGENYPRFATKTAVALAWKDRKPGISMTSIKNGFMDAVAFPAKIFKLNGMTFTPSHFRNLAYWIGIALGVLAYFLLAIILSRR